MNSPSPTTAAPKAKRIFPKTTGLTALWRHRQPLQVLIRRDLAVKYQATVMGYLWSLIEPLGLAAIYGFIFGFLYNKGGLPDDISYILYVVSGIFAWQWASSAMSESTTSLTGQSTLITTMRVPREVFPVARVFARFAEFAAGFPIVLLVVWLFGGQVGWHTLYLLLALVVQAILLVGISFILASLNVLYRDVQRFMRLIMRMMFYATPIIYPLAKVMDALHSRGWDWAANIYLANPFVGVMQMHRAAWITDSSMAVGTTLLWTCIGTSVFLLFFGRWLFYRLEPRVLKEL